MDRKSYLTNQLNKLITPEEAADILGISKGTLEVWRSTKRYNLKFIKVGRRVMYRITDVNEFIEHRLISQVQI